MFQPHLLKYETDLVYWPLYPCDGHGLSEYLESSSDSWLRSLQSRGWSWDHCPEQVSPPGAGWWVLWPNIDHNTQDKCQNCLKLNFLCDQEKRQQKLLKRLKTFNNVKHSICLEKTLQASEKLCNLRFWKENKWMHLEVIVIRCFPEFFFFSISAMSPMTMLTRAYSIRDRNTNTVHPDMKTSMAWNQENNQLMGQLSAYSPAQLC